MAEEIVPHKPKLPKIQDLYEDKSESYANDVFVALMNNPPQASWVKEHPYVKGYLYLPIDKIEYLLKKIFKQNYRIEVLKTGLLLNSVEVTVRVHYKDVVSGEWSFHDGVGCQEIQTFEKTGSLKLDMSNISRGALTMALPIAKSVAIKDACDHFGRLFGSDLNRKDLLIMDIDNQTTLDWVKLEVLFDDKKDRIPSFDYKDIEDAIVNKTIKLYQRTLDRLNKIN